MISLFRVPAVTGVASVGLFVLRAIAGLGFMLHGWGKIQSPMSWMGPDAPVPGFLQLLAAVSEFGGGIAIIIGLLTPLALFGMICTMVVAVHFHAVVKGDPFVSMAPGGSSFEPALMYFAVFFALLAVGPGKYSLDAKIFGQKS